ncbi:MAG: hypothetical protein GX558_10060 [Clostridiales bacterium]|nr:hypothetical protein [Clostridiales bacterium]
MDIDSSPAIGAILRDARNAELSNFRLIRAQRGVRVYRCGLNGGSAIAKYFECCEDRREIGNYRMLAALGVPTLRAHALGETSILLEDIAASTDWRLGAEGDLADPHVGGAIADWYFCLHEAGAAAPGLGALYCETDAITDAALAALCEKLPEAAGTLRRIAERIGRLRALLDALPATLTYNDFYWTNLAVRNDRRQALMFDYNLLGRGYRYADIRNVLSALQGGAAEAFSDRYALLYRRMHGADWAAEERGQQRIDRVASPLCTLIAAFDRPQFPDWAQAERAAAVDGSLRRAAAALLA